jgi:hypothetical protein
VDGLLRVKSLHLPQFVFTQAHESLALFLSRPPLSLASFRLSKIENKRYHPYQDEPDAHQIIEDFRKNHHYYAKGKANDSSNEPQSW